MAVVSGGVTTRLLAVLRCCDVALIDALYYRLGLLTQGAVAGIPARGTECLGPALGSDHDATRERQSWLCISPATYRGIYGCRHEYVSTISFPPLLSPLPCVFPFVSAVPDAAEHKRERDSIDRGVRMGQDRLKKAKADRLAAFDEAMQEAASNGFETQLAAMTREQRYQIFFDNLQEAEKRNKKAGPDEVYTVDFFSVFTQQELRSFRGMPPAPQVEGIGGGRRLLYNNPSMAMPCSCGGPSERSFQYGAVDVTNIPAVTWRQYTTPIRNQQSSSACGMFAVTAVIEVGFYMKWYTLGWNTSNIDLSEQDLVSGLASRACSTALTTQHIQLQLQ